MSDEGLSIPAGSPLWNALAVIVRHAAGERLSDRPRLAERLMLDEHLRHEHYVHALILCRSLDAAAVKAAADIIEAWAATQQEN